MCGASRQFALRWLADLEVATCPELASGIDISADGNR
jgi:hypothetical protein